MAVYLDYNASAPIDERVLERMIEVYRSHYGNADSRTHIFGMDAKEIVSSARKTIAEILAVDSTDVFFTSGSTESNNMAIPYKLNNCGRVFTSAVAANPGNHVF